MTKIFNHAVTLAFEIESLKEDMSDITANMVLIALNRRIAGLIADNAILEATCHDSFDMYESTVEDSIEMNQRRIKHDLEKQFKIGRFNQEGIE